MILGVKEGYEKKLELQGVGYVCQIKGKTLSLRVGLANELTKEIPEGLDALALTKLTWTSKVATSKKLDNLLPKFVLCVSQSLTKAKEFVTLVNRSKSNLVSRLSSNQLGFGRPFKSSQIQNNIQCLRT